MDHEALQHAAQGGGELHSSGGLPQLDPSSFESQVFWLIVVFSVLYYVFSKKSLPEISEVIETRSESIRSNLDSAQELKEQVEAVQKAYEENLEKARLDAVNSYKLAEEEIKSEAEQEVKAFYSRSSKQVAEMEKNIEKAKAAALDDINDIATEIALDAAEKIIGVRFKAAKAA